MKWLVLLLLLPSLSGANDVTSKADESKLTPISLQLLWKHQFEFAGFYAAIEQGYYRDVGLEVSLKEFEAGTDVIDEVVSGRAQYGVHDSSLMISREKGSPVVLLKNIFQHSPMVLIAKADSGIFSPAQMVGKKVMLATHEQGNASISAMLAHESVTIDQLEVIEHTFNVDDFVSGKVDVMSSYVTNEVGVLKQMNIPIHVIHPLNYGIDFYGSNIFTSEQEIKEYPERVEKFISASLKGWEYALNHQEEIVDLILKKYSQKKSREALVYEAEAVENIVLPQYIDLGTVDAERMKRIVETYQRLGLLSKDFLLEDFFYRDADEGKKGLNYTEEEEVWIHENPFITLGVDPNWAPFEFLSEDGDYAGMAADFMRLIEEKSGLTIQVQNNATWKDVIDSAKAGNLDVLPAVMRSTQREEFLNFTTPHINYPMVILTDRDSRFVSSLDDLEGERVVVVDGYVTEDLLRQNHPGLDLVVAKDINQAIEWVSQGEVHAFVDNLASISQTIADRGYTNLRISGTTKYEFALSLGVPKGKPVLLSILQKSLDAISEEEAAKIRKRWVSVSYAETIDYTLVIQIVLIALAFLTVILIWNRRLSTEIQSRKIAEEKVKESELRFRLLFEENKAVELIVDPSDGQIVEANNAAVDFYGYSHDHICSMYIDQINTLTEGEVSEEMARAKTEARTHFYFQHKLASGEVRDVEVHSGPVQWNGREMLYSIIHDVTIEKRLQDELAEKTERLTYQATHDALTGLINRREFEVRLERMLASCKAVNTKCDSTVVFMDLDHFKIVNDTAGHAAGDEVLRKVGKLLHARIRDRDTLARLGGDEFGLLLEHCSVKDAVAIVLSIIQEIKDFQFVWKDDSFRIGISMGITAIGDSLSLDEVLSEADDACYVAKKQGRNGYHVFNQENEEFIKRKGEMWWTNEIIRATEENRLVLYRQDVSPIDAVNGVGEHYEVLIRMLDQDGDLVLPGHFLPAAERYKLMSQIDAWVVNHLFDWFASHPQAIDALHMCCINLSGQSLGEKGFTSMLVKKIEEGVVPAEKLCWEVTETAAIANFKEAQSFITVMKGLGCSFSLDDFGSGLSSFNYLKNLDVDYLKIDGSFVKDMLVDSKDKLIVESIHSVGNGLKMKTIAEFVENKEILDKLKEIGVDYAQGYGIDRPAPFSI